MCYKFTKLLVEFSCADYICIMAEDLNIISGSKTEQYQSLIPQIKALLEGEPDVIANLANVTAALKQQFGWLWTGFYLVKGEELVLGPFQGPVACTRIRYGRGVCGTSWEQARTLVVPDVEKFPGHIACSSLSRSEIVVPVIRNGVVAGVLDVDSEHLDHFDEVDARYLEEIVGFLNL
jgi:GAF domain-containing protein